MENKLKDINEFLECLKIDVDHIDKLRADYKKAYKDLDSSLEYRGALIMGESEGRTDLYKFCKEHLPQFLKNK